MSHDKTITTYHNVCFFAYNNVLYVGVHSLSSDQRYDTHIEVQRIDDKHQASECVFDHVQENKLAYPALDTNLNALAGAQHTVNVRYHFASLNGDKDSWNFNKRLFDDSRQFINNENEYAFLVSVINPETKIISQHSIDPSKPMHPVACYGENVFGAQANFSESDLKSFCATVLHHSLDLLEKARADQPYQNLLEEINRAIENRAAECDQNSNSFTSLGLFGSRYRASTGQKSIAAPAFIDHIQSICRGEHRTKTQEPNPQQDFQQIMTILKNEDPRHHYWITRFITALLRFVTGRWQTQEQVNCATNLLSDIEARAQPQLVDPSPIILKV